MYGFYLSPYNKDNTSEVIVGGYDSKMVKSGDIHWSNSILEDVWTVNLTYVKIGGNDANPSKYGIISGLPYLGIPIGAAYFAFESAVLKSQMCQSNLNEYGAFVCVADLEITKLPNITMKINDDIEINITAEYYVYNRTVNKEDIYFLGIKPLEEDVAFVLGSPFMNRVYTILDFDKKKIGLASIFEMENAVP